MPLISLQLFFFLILFIYLFLAVLGLRFCARAFSSCGKWGPLFIAVRGPLTTAASLVAEHRLQTRRLSSCGSRTQSPRGMWDPPRPGLEPVSPALAGRFPTTASPGKPLSSAFEEECSKGHLTCCLDTKPSPLQCFVYSTNTLFITMGNFNFLASTLNFYSNLRGRHNWFLHLIDEESKT